MFAGASRAFLASTVFAFEATLQPFSLLPLLGGCAASYLAATLLMETSLMTEKIVRRGVATTHEYAADLLAQVTVREIAGHPVIILHDSQTVANVRQWFAEGAEESKHAGFPVLDTAGNLVGVLMRHEILDRQLADTTKLKDLLRRLPKFVYDDCTVRQAVDHMARHEHRPAARDDARSAAADWSASSPAATLFRLSAAAWQKAFANRRL